MLLCVDSGLFVLNSDNTTNKRLTTAKTIFSSHCSVVCSDVNCPGFKNKSVYKSVCYLTFDLSRDFPDEFMISDSNGTIIQKSRVKKGIKAGRI